jgi:hypothetical protein
MNALDKSKMLIIREFVLDARGTEVMYVNSLYIPLDIFVNKKSID